VVALAWWGQANRWVTGWQAGLGSGSGSACRGVASDGSSRAGAAGRVTRGFRMDYGVVPQKCACFCLCVAMGSGKRLLGSESAGVVVASLVVTCEICWQFGVRGLGCWMGRSFEMDKIGSVLLTTFAK
jgi:hypothetical protein